MSALWPLGGVSLRVRNSAAISSGSGWPSSVCILTVMGKLLPAGRGSSGKLSGSIATSVMKFAADSVSFSSASSRATCRKLALRQLPSSAKDDKKKKDCTRLTRMMLMRM